MKLVPTTLSYWACEAGLSRDTSQTDIESFLFPAFHNVLDTTVADKIAAMIQSNLPANCFSEALVVDTS